MNIALITDTHFGIKDGDEDWLNSMKTFFIKEFIPYLKKHKIKDIIHLGDLFDDREHTDNKIFTAVYELFEEFLKDFNVYCIVGNHDSYYNSRIDVSITKFLNKFSNVTLIDKNTVIEFDKRKILLCPWQADWEKFAEDITNNYKDVDTLMGHLPVTGFLLNNKVASHKGVSPNLFFDNFKWSFSGHYHTRSEQVKNGSYIIYIGNTYHLTRHDIGDDRGFTILNTDTMDRKYINTTKTIKFLKVEYPNKIDPKDIKGNIIDIHVRYDDNYDEKEFAKYINKIEENSPLLEPKIKGENVLIENEELDEDYKSTLDLIKKYVLKQEDINDKEVVNEIIEDIYNKCLLAVDE